jgi:hypothetical protein
MGNKLYVDTIGATIKLDMQGNISTASAYSFSVLRPDGTIKTWMCTIDGTDYFQHILVAEDIDIPGTYLIVPMFTISSWTGPGDTVSVVVYEKFK